MKNSNQLNSQKNLVLVMLTVMFVIVNAFMLYISYSRARSHVELTSSEVVNIIHNNVRSNSNIAAAMGTMLQLSDSSTDSGFDTHFEGVLDHAQRSSEAEAKGFVGEKPGGISPKKIAVIRSFWKNYQWDERARFLTYYTDGDSGYSFVPEQHGVVRVVKNNPQLRLQGYLKRTVKQLTEARGFSVPALFYSNIYQDIETRLPSITVGFPVVLNDFNAQVSKVSGIVATDYTSRDLTVLFKQGFSKLNAKIDGYDIRLYNVKNKQVYIPISPAKFTLVGFTVSNIRLTNGYRIDAIINLRTLINSMATMFIDANLLMILLSMLFLKVHASSSLMLNRLTTDSLTLALSREGGRRIIERLSTADNTALVIIDLNDFKIINDTYGHHTGDEALAFFSRYMLKALRKEDSLIRMGGDEFVVLLGNMSVEQAETKMAQLAAGLRSFPHEQRDIPLTFSYGVSRVTDDFSDSYDRADKNLYRMKRQKNALKKEALPGA